MKIKPKRIRVVIIFILLIILAGQAIWVYNLYQAQHQIITQAKNEALQTAILREHGYRYEQMGGMVASRAPTHRDTSRFFTKTITLKDTSFQVQFDRYDPYNDVKLSQFILKDHLVLNTNMVDNLFREELARRGVYEARTYIEYIDLENDDVLQQSEGQDSEGKRKIGEYTASELIIIDIFDTLGIKGYIHVPSSAITKAMTIQLFLTALLIIICTFFLSIVLRTFSWHRRMESMRQNSVNTMIHEFKRPISVAVAQLSLTSHYQERGNTAKVEQYAQQSLLELQKLNSYTERIQKLSNNSGETIPISKQHINLQDFFNSLLAKQKALEENTVKLTLSLQTTQTTIYADLLHVANVMDNVIENAIKYAKNEGVEINISISDERDQLKISVKDNGLGISKKDLPRIFQKFYRSENRNIQRKTGYGLGLTYVKAVVEAHDGEIKVESKFGIGTEFIVYFPRQNDAE